MSIWVPSSMQDREAAKINAVVRRYDPDLGFGKNEQTGQWCVFMRQGSTQMADNKDLPVLGFNHIPSEDEVMHRLHKTDARRRGREILDELNKHNEDIREVKRKGAEDAAGIAAEAWDWFLRKDGTHPFPRVFFPGR
ncbi:MAG TPA: hypothetical protein VIY48_03035 [Candidatus Paceibacterota bacterium]